MLQRFPINEQLAGGVFDDAVRILARLLIYFHGKSSLIRGIEPENNDTLASCDPFTPLEQLRLFDRLGGSNGPRRNRYRWVHTRIRRCCSAYADNERFDFHKLSPLAL
jgi:hypothetical protein